MYREAYKASQIKYETLIKGGVNKDTAKEASLYKDILLNVDKYDDIKNMTQEAKESTKKTASFFCIKSIKFTWW